MNRPVIVTSRGDLASVLRQARIDRGETCLASDARSGFHDGYTAKLEHPDSKSGKRGLHLSPMAEVWLKANALALVVMPAAQAEALGAVEAA